MNQRDLLVRIDSEFQDKGFKSAEASAKSMVRELDRQEAEVRKVANMQAAAAREEKARHDAQLQSYGRVGRAVTTFGLVTAAGMGLAAKSAMDWESAWTGVTKTVDGSAEEMAALQQQLRDLAKELPATHEEIAGVAAAAGQLGVAQGDIAGFTKTMIDLGESTNLSAEEAATTLARLGKVMGTLPSDADRAGSAIVELGNNSATTESEIAQMALRLGGAGKTIGLTEADVLGFAAALSSVGVEAEAGGSAFSRVMVDISKAVTTGSDELDTFAQVAGMTSDQFAVKFRDDATGAINAFVSGLGRMQASGEDVFSTLDDLGLGQVRVRDALLRTANAGDLLTKSVDMSNSAWAENTALVEEANKRYETAESRIKIARNQLNDAAIDIGGTVLPALAGVAERVGALAEAWQKLPGPAKDAVGILGTVVSVLGLAGGAALIAIPKFAALSATLETLGRTKAAARVGRIASVLTGPWALAIGGAVTLLGVWAEKQFEANQRAEELKKTLDAQTGAFTENTRMTVAKKLADEGLLDVAKRLGIEQGTVTDAILGSAPAQREVNTAIEDAIALGDKLGGTTRDTLGMYQANKKGAQDLASAMGGLNGDLDGAQEKWSLLNGEIKSGDGTMSKAADSSSGFADSVGDIEKSAKDARDELDKLAKAVEGYGSEVEAAIGANSDYEAALDDAKAALKENGKTLDITTEKGRANQDALLAIADAAKSAATANFKNGDSLKDVKDKMQDARTQFVNMATDMGLSKKEAKKLADQLGLTKDNVETLGGSVDNLPTSHTIDIEARTAAALDRVRAFQRAVNALHGKSIRITTTGTLPNGGRSMAGGITFAEGGYTGPYPKDQLVGGVHGQEFVVKPNPTAEWRPLLEAMNRGMDPRAFLGGQTAGPAVAGPTTYAESYDQRVMPAVMNVYANDPRRTSEAARQDLFAARVRRMM